ncbi:Lon protease [Koleobacter methoxysyntrophicus]|uniref:endopeptidase La n=1 Tax=Koleobacter methoxysyntrophicus TaxID=2751313 RepID=A0A8A0RLL9_9FIRM|nr:ATP-binding protein [Koleobacter methoxysyntrophicus]QSQ08792.1 Lon protease [Koleobacter methoxysyntrophicus]
MTKYPREIPADELKQVCPPELFNFKTTEEIQPLQGIIGQERAVKAMEFGLNINNKGYNIYIAGQSGTGKTTYARTIVSKKAKEGKIPDDWCYIYNFHQPEKPLALRLPAGKGTAFVKDMENLIDELREDIPKAFDSEEYEKQKVSVMERYQEESNKLIEELEERALEEGFMLKRTGKGIITVPLIDGKPLEPGEYDNLPEETKKKINEKTRIIQSWMDEVMRKIKALEQQARGELADIEKKLGLAAVKPSIDHLKDKYRDFPEAVAYLEEVQKDIIKHISAFIGKDDKNSPFPFPLPVKDDSFFVRYKINLFVNNRDTEGAPVVWETNPTYYNLFGKIEGRSQFGAVTTDFTMIRSGSIHRANGGYLILQAEDVLKDPFAWDALKRTLENQEAVVENIGEQYRTMPTVTLKPQPIPINVKVILIGSPWVYQLLYNLDRDFRELFKIKAQFDTTMERNEENIKKYTAFISAVCTREGLLHFEAGAVSRVIEHSCRMAEEKGKLSTRFNEIVEVLYEASAWARADGSRYVTADHVEKAIVEKVARSNLVEEKVREMIERGHILVDTEGSVVGQVNGLSVYHLGDYAFGQPSRITARTFLGEKGVINIEREVELSGSIHDKGVLILSGFLGGQYASDKPLTLSASLCFEQNYGGVDGDSATCAELIALLSSISGIPVKQNLAITGSLNQRGEVQPIGGVNHKIEGFFKVCRAKGLTGDQGVVIPHQNVENLMLSGEVIEAVRDGKFHIYTAKTIDDCIELMTGVSAEEFHKKVNESLEGFARMAEEFSSIGRGEKGDKN